MQPNALDEIICLNGTSHTHSTITDIIKCIGTRNIFVTNMPPTGGNWVEQGNRNPFPKNEQPTPRQLDYYESLGGDSYFAKHHMSKAQVSAQIDFLKRGGKPTPTTPVSAPVPSSQSPAVAQVQPVSPAPVLREVGKSMFAGPFLELLEKVPDGNFAVRAEEGAPITFLRLTRPTSGEYKGCIKLQTRHADRLEIRWVRWPSGKISIYKSDIEDKLLLLIPTYREAARLYAKELGCCARCNIDLTDERSRYFSIGPECEKYWPWMIDEKIQEVLEAGEVPKFT